MNPANYYKSTLSALQFGAFFSKTEWGRYCFGFSAILLSSLAFAAPPVAVDDTRTIPANTSITLNPLSNDFDPDGNNIFVLSIGTPGNGTATLNPDGSVRYVPEPDFIGVDQFTYTIQETEQALTATATITINVTEGRYQDWATNSNSRGLGQTLDSLCSRLRSSSDGELGAARSDLLNLCNSLDTLNGSDPSTLNSVLQQFTPEETIAQMRIAADSSRFQLGAVSQRLQQLISGVHSINSFTLNGMTFADTGSSGGGASADEPIWSRLGAFATIQYDNAERDMTQLENGYDYSATSFTVGIDYRLDPEKVIGAALGLTRNDLEFSNQSGKLETDIYTLLVFGSLHKNRFAVDVQLGYADTQYDSWRYIDYTANSETVSETLIGSTYGSQLLFNTQVQWEWHKDALSLYPFARMDYVRNSTKGYGEQGNSGLVMNFSDQSMDQLTLGLGVQGSYAISQRWGVLIPTAELTLLSDVRSDFDPVTARFAYDPDPNNVFNLQSDGGESRYFQASIGASALFARGASAFFQYRQLIDYSNLSAYQIQAGIRHEF